MDRSILCGLLWIDNQDMKRKRKLRLVSPFVKRDGQYSSTYEYNSHLVVMVVKKGMVDHILASRVGLLLFWWKRWMKRNSSKFQLLYVNRKKTKSERYRVRDTQTWSKSITLKILSLSLGILSTPERWPDFSSFSNIALERHNRPRN